jgi:hypothetical protein
MVFRTALFPPRVGRSVCAGVGDYDRDVNRWKASRPVLVALVVLHIIVTTITLRDLSRRTDAQIHGPRLFWRVFTPLQMGNSAIYWLVGRRREISSTQDHEGPQISPSG